MILFTLYNPIVLRTNINFFREIKITFHFSGTFDIFQSSIQAMKKFEQNPDFILWTGDSSPHWWKPDSPSWDYIFKTEKMILGHIQKIFPNATIIPVLGNHDSYKPNNFTSNNISTKGHPKSLKTKNYLHFLHGANWTQFIPEGEAQTDFAFCGHYLREFNEDFWIMVLNTNLYYNTHLREHDPCLQVKTCPQNSF